MTLKTAVRCGFDHMKWNTAWYGTPSSTTSSTAKLCGQRAEAGADLPQRRAVRRVGE